MRLEHTLGSLESFGADFDCAAIWELDSQMDMIEHKSNGKDAAYRIALNENGGLFRKSCIHIEIIAD